MTIYDIWQLVERATPGPWHVKDGIIYAGTTPVPATPANLELMAVGPEAISMLIQEIEDTEADWDAHSCSCDCCG